MSDLSDRRSQAGQSPIAVKRESGRRARERERTREHPEEWAHAPKLAAQWESPPSARKSPDSYGHPERTKERRNL